MDKDLKLEADKRFCRFYRQDKVIAMGERLNKLFEMKFRLNTSDEELHENSQACVATSNNLDTWNQRMAHQNYDAVKKVLKSFDIKVKEEKELFCEPCAVGKIHSLPFPTSETKTSRIGEVVHADLCGPLSAKSLKAARYFLLIKYDYSHFRKVYFLAAKSDTLACKMVKKLQLKG